MFTGSSSIDFFYVIDTDNFIPVSLRQGAGKYTDDGCLDHYTDEDKIAINTICKAINQSHRDISMSANGVCERSTATETRKPWTRNLWDPQEGLYWKIRDYIGPDETIYGENLYGEHSIHYENLDNYFHLFAVNDGVNWYSWDDAKMMANIMNIPYVPL